MADIINFTLPKIDGNTDTQAMKQIKNYLFQLTEQMKFYLNNIDTDNFTDEYQQKLSNMLTTSDTNATEISRTQSLINQFNNDYKNEIQDSVQKITGNKGGYIVLRDSDNDTFPDELLVMDTSDYMTAQNIWRFNKMGFMHSNGGYDGFGTNIAITMDGKINADYISAGTLKGIRIEAAQGIIGGWNIVNYGLLKTNGENKLGIQAEAEDESDIFKTFFVDYGGKEKFYVKNDGKLYAIDATISGAITATSGDIAGFLLSNNRMVSDDGNGRYSAEIRGYNFDQYHTFIQVNDEKQAYGTRYPFVVQYDGSVYANNLTISSVYTNRKLVIENGDFYADTVIFNNSPYCEILWDTSHAFFTMHCKNNDIKIDGRSATIAGSVYMPDVAEYAITSTLKILSLTNGKGKVVTEASISSKRYKKNITDINLEKYNVQKLYDLKIKQFEYKPEFAEHVPIKGEQIGIIAEDVKELFPNACLYNLDGQVENWSERILIPAMLKLIQEQHTEIENLKRIVKGV